ncbi:flavodoxin family protein [bacterium]|nr:flavodoxin family protein [bacterium]
MSQKIVVVQGSPRKNGNTRAITKVVIEAAQENGAEVSEIDVTTLDFKEPGCIGCQKCQYSDVFKCALDDGIAQKVATLPEYNTIVLATPLYWWSYSAQIKMFVDRMYSLSKLVDPANFRSQFVGKTLALIATARGPLRRNLELLESQWRRPAEMLGCEFLSCLFPNTSAEAGMLGSDQAAVAKAQEFGRKLAST